MHVPGEDTVLHLAAVDSSSQPEVTSFNMTGDCRNNDLDTSVLDSTPTISACLALHNNPEALKRKGGEREEERRGEMD